MRTAGDRYDRLLRGVLASSNVYRGRRARWAVVEATLVVTVTDARGGEQLQRHRIFARDEGSDFALMRRTVLERLAVNLVEDLQVRGRR